MYYLRKEPYEMIIPETKLADSSITKERKILSDDRAIYKHHDYSRFYRGGFHGINGKYNGMRVYTCKTLKNILKLRESIHNYCNELFDVYDENGKVNIDI